MSDTTAIEWTDATWNPITGCTLVDDGCKNCYAAKLASTRLKNHPSRAGLARLNTAGVAKFTGEVRFNSQWLDQPLTWRKPRRIFVCAHGDLFHENVPDDWIDQVFAVMALCPQHTFQCLTKRSDRMRAYVSDPDTPFRVVKAMDALKVDLVCDGVERWSAIPEFPQYQASSLGQIRRDGKIIQPHINERFDRPSVTLWQANKPRTMWVHTLVLLAHVGEPEEGEEACHKNGNSRDNRLANLRWGTRSENQQEKVRHGAQGGPAKISRHDAGEIRRLRAAGETQQSIADKFGVSRPLISMIESRQVWPDADLDWPLPNVWLGTSVSDQASADARIPDLLATPAAVRFISAEPLLGPVDLTNLCDDGYSSVDALREYPAFQAYEDWGDEAEDMGPFSDQPALDWVIVGGESGPHARDWEGFADAARSLRDQCAAAGTDFFMKQMPKKAPIPADLMVRQWPESRA